MLRPVLHRGPRVQIAVPQKRCWHRRRPFQAHPLLRLRLPCGAANVCLLWAPCRRATTPTTSEGPCCLTAPAAHQAWPDPDDWARGSHSCSCPSCVSDIQEARLGAKAAAFLIICPTESSNLLYLINNKNWLTQKRPRARRPPCPSCCSEVVALKSGGGAALGCSRIADSCG